MSKNKKIHKHLHPHLHHQTPDINILTPNYLLILDIYIFIGRDFIKFR
jgi:hypothetical protein